MKTEVQSITFKCGGCNNLFSVPLLNLRFGAIQDDIVFYDIVCPNCAYLEDKIYLIEDTIYPRR